MAAAKSFLLRKRGLPPGGTPSPNSSSSRDMDRFSHPRSGVHERVQENMARYSIANVGNCRSRLYDVGRCDKQELCGARCRKGREDRSADRTSTLAHHALDGGVVEAGGG